VPEQSSRLGDEPVCFCTLQVSRPDFRLEAHQASHQTCPSRVILAWLKHHASVNHCLDTLTELMGSARRLLESGQTRKLIVTARWKHAESW